MDLDRSWQCHLGCQRWEWLVGGAILPWICGCCWRLENMQPSPSPRLWRSDFQRQLGACGPCVGLHVSPADSPRHRLLQRSLPVKFDLISRQKFAASDSWNRFNMFSQGSQGGAEWTELPGQLLKLLLLARQWHRVVRIGSEPWRFFRSAKPCASDLKLCLGEQCKTHKKWHHISIIYAMWQHCDTAIPAAIPTDPADFVRILDTWWMFVVVCRIYGNLYGNLGDLQRRHQLLRAALDLGHPSLLGDERGIGAPFQSLTKRWEYPSWWQILADCFMIFHYLHQLSVTIQWLGWLGGK